MGLVSLSYTTLVYPRLMTRFQDRDSHWQLVHHDTSLIFSLATPVHTKVRHMFHGQLDAKFHRVIRSVT